jgi:hypothetical protein
MHVITHFLVGWMVANAASLSRRERAVVALAGVVPDLDGLGIIAELLTRDSARPLLWWSEFHHVLGHNLGFALLTAGVACALSSRRWTTTGLALASFHLHLLGDLAGSRGPEGYQWPIPYLLPFSDAWQWTWSGQWELNAWPNIALTTAALAAALILAWRRGFSPLELFSVRGDRALVETLRARLPRG